MSILFSNDPPRPLWRRIFYLVVWCFTATWFLLFFRLRVHHIERAPTSGTAMIMLNHQSNLDPIIMGTIYPCRVSFLAKKTLFEKVPLKWVLYGLDCIPIDRSSVGIGGMKETLRRLKRGERIVLFPEGQRSFDGEMLPLMSGFCALVKRTKSPIVPMGIDGPFQSWPRGTAIPKSEVLHVYFGETIPFEKIEHLTDEAMTNYVAQEIKACFRKARELRNRDLAKH